MARRPTEIVRDEQTLAPIAGVSISVITAATGLAATLTLDGGGALANPLTTDDYGRFYYNAADAIYLEEYRYGGRLIRVVDKIVGSPPEIVGPAGPANVLSVGTVTKVAAGGTPTVSITGTAPAQTLNVGLVTGDKGDPGPTGGVGPAGYTTTDTWAHLNAITPTSGAGSTGFAVGPDTGTHTDANGATSIPNTGQFSYQASPTGWIRIGSSTGPVDVTAAIAASRAAILTSNLKAAAGADLTNKLLLNLVDGTKTFNTGSTTDVTAVTSSDAGARSFTGNSTLFTATPKYPTYDATKGITFTRETGLEFTSAVLLSQTLRFAIHWTAQFFAPDVTYATQALRDAAISGGSTPAIGTIALVNADANVDNVAPRDVLDPRDGGYQSHFVNGYSIRGFGTTSAAWSVEGGTGNPARCWTIKDSVTANNYIKFQVNHIGQAELVLQQASPSVFEFLRVPALDLISDGGIHSFALVATGDGLIRLLVDGAEVDAVYAPTFNLTNLNTYYLNGETRNANVNIPVSGWHWACRTFSIDEPTTSISPRWDSIKKSVLALAGYNATPAPRDKRLLRIVAMDGQSEAMAQTSVTGGFAWANSYAYMNGWTGNVTKDGPSSGPQSIGLANPSRKPMPNIFVSSMDTPWDIGPLYIRGNGSGTAFSTSHVMVPTVETIEYGFMTQILKYPEAWECDWLLVHSAASGTTLATLSSMSTPPKVLPSVLFSATTASLTTREKKYRALLWGKRFAEQRGMRAEVFAWINSQGKADAGNSAYKTAAVLDFQTVDAWIKGTFGQSYSPIYAKNQVALSNLGTNLDSNLTPAFFDQQLLDMIALMATAGLPYVCVGSVYPFSQRIHHPYYRPWGELYGDRIGRMAWGGESGAPLMFTATRNNVGGIGGNGVRLDYGEAVSFIDTSGLGIVGRVQTAAVDTYGYALPASTVTSVTNVGGGIVDIATSASVSASAHLYYTGPLNWFGNVRSATQRLGDYPGIDPTGTITGGNLALNWGVNNDISRWGASQHVVLT